MNIYVIISDSLARGAGVKTATEALFRDEYPILSAEAPIDGIGFGDVVLFSGFNKKCYEITRQLRNKGVKIAVFWHFSFAIISEPDVNEDWNYFQSSLLKGDINLVLSCREDIVEVMNNLYGVKCIYIMNNIHNKPSFDDKKIGIGVYNGSMNYWAKNVSVNLHAALMMDCPVDVIPFDKEVQRIVAATRSKKISGVDSPLSYEDFLSRMERREIIFAVSFTEAMPMLPLEALNVGTLVLTGNNHELFTGDEFLRDSLVVSCMDNPLAIAQAAKRALQNRDEILKRYTKWKEKFDRIQELNFYSVCRTLEKLL